MKYPELSKEEERELFEFDITDQERDELVKIKKYYETLIELMEYFDKKSEFCTELMFMCCALTKRHSEILGYEPLKINHFPY